MGIVSRARSRISSIFRRGSSSSSTTQQYSTPSSGFQGPVQPGTDEQTFRTTGRSQPPVSRSGGGGSGGGIRAAGGTTAPGTTATEEELNMSLRPDLRNKTAQEVNERRITPPKQSVKMSAPIQGPVPPGANEQEFRSTGRTTGARIPTRTEQQLNMSLDPTIRNEPVENVETRQSVDLYGSLLRNDNVTFGSTSYQYAGGFSGIDGSSSLAYYSNRNSPYDYGQTPPTKSQQFFGTFKEVGKYPFESPRNFVSSALIAGSAFIPIAGPIVVGTLTANQFIRTARNPTPQNLAYSTAAILPYAGGKVFRAGFRATETAFAYPRSTSTILGKSTNVVNTELGYTAKTTAMVATTRTGLTGSKTYISRVNTKSRIQFEENSFTSQSFSTATTYKVSKGRLKVDQNAYTGSYTTSKGSVIQASKVDAEAFVSTGITKTRLINQKQNQFFFSQTKGITQKGTTVFAGESAPLYKQGGYLGDLRLGRGGRGQYSGAIKTAQVAEEGSGIRIIVPSGKGSRPSYSQANIASSVSENAAVSAASSYVKFTGYTPTYGTGAAAVTRVRSAYYGTGQYERTDFVSFGSPSQAQALVKGPQDLVNRRGFQTLDYSSLSTQTKTGTRTSSVILVRRAGSLGFGGSAILALSSQAQISRLGLAQRSRGRLTPGRSGSSFFNFTPPNYTGGPPIAPLLPFSFDELGLPSNPVRGGRTRYAYVPSYSALVFGITGRKRRRGYETGFNFRPIPVGYKFT